MAKNIYAIIDNLAQEVVGLLWIMPHDAVAVRQFSDIAARTDNGVAQHIEDHDLVSLGRINEDTLELEPAKYIVITGRSWKAAQAPRDQQLSLTEEQNHG